MIRRSAPTVSSDALGLGHATDAECTLQSKRWFDRATKALAGGVSSSARTTVCGELPYPLYFTRGEGSRLFDADGHQFLDYLLGYGSSILGHAHPAMVDALGRQAAMGTMFGTCNTAEVELAEQIKRMVPCADLVRFANSGSEAICGAIRAARGYTGKSKILKFEGHYHGWVDVLAISNRPTLDEAGPLDHPHSAAHSKGTPEGVVADVIICPWNHPELLIHILNEHGHELAAIVAEPIVANNACLMPEPGYLELLREECTRRGIVLIFDEIVTGFRTSPGGAQDLFGVIPDIAAYAKAIGGGMPLAAFAGKREFMELIASNTVKHGGTYNGNPMCAVAGLTALRALAREDVQDRIAAHGEQLIDAIRRAAHDLAIDCQVCGVGSMFQVIFAARAPRHYRDLLNADVKRYAAFRHALLERGVHASTSPTACWFVSAVHDDDDAQLAIAAIEQAMALVA